MVCNIINSTLGNRSIGRTTGFDPVYWGSSPYSPAMIKLVGKTTTGSGVVTGVYRYYETYGIPLDVLFEELRKRNFVPDWNAFIQEALAAGMKKLRILSMLSPALSDTYGTEFCNYVIAKLEQNDS